MPSTENTRRESLEIDAHRATGRGIRLLLTPQILQEPVRKPLGRNEHPSPLLASGFAQLRAQDLDGHHGAAPPHGHPSPQFPRPHPAQPLQQGCMPVLPLSSPHPEVFVLPVRLRILQHLALGFRCDRHRSTDRTRTLQAKAQDVPQKLCCQAECRHAIHPHLSGAAPLCSLSGCDSSSATLPCTTQTAAPRMV
ncbi:hypothetical protein SAMN05216303_102811 [Rhodoferax sp. OV413]|nr:hypothetical protein SAMN05216303_102811 [Rhodoferax sp. OV413]